MIASEKSGTAGWYKYGMLSFILILALFSIVVYARFPEARSAHVANLVVVSMLFVNHVSSAFLAERWQRRMMIPQFLFIGFGLAYLVSLMKR
jgi:hypothetical protein